MILALPRFFFQYIYLNTSLNIYLCIYIYIFHVYERDTGCLRKYRNYIL